MTPPSSQAGVGPTIAREEYALRRERLMASLGPGSMVVVAAAPRTLRNGDTHYPYRQHSDFYYLTGFKEPHGLAVLLGQGREGRFILFNRAHDAKETLWNGTVVGQQGACEVYGADEAYPIEAFDQAFLPLLKQCQTLYVAVDHNAVWKERLDPIVKEAMAHGGVASDSSPRDVKAILHEQRLIKSSGEIALLSQAAEMTAEAHQRLMKHCEPGGWEYDIEGVLLQYFHQQGCRRVAYPSIVASGANACVLHYENNHSQLQSGELLLVDAGVEYNYYAADVTRTYPVNGRFSSQQRDLYSIVLQAQLAGIHTVKPGIPWDSIQGAMVKVITEGLIDLGLLRGELSSLIEQGAYKQFYPHSSGHWLGLDVHDVGSYKLNGEWRPLQQGMVFTVEPGIYIAPTNDTVPESWRGIGIRIEDDVVVTAEGHSVLSAAVPKTINDIETCMAS